MPDDQMTSDATSFEPAFATVADETAITLPGSKSSVSRPVTPVGHAEPLLVPHEVLIQNAYVRCTPDAEPVRDAIVYPVLKRALDFSLSVLALIVLSPLLLAIAIVIRIDSPGPALFRQQRVGQDGRLFTMYKFRSMTNGAGVRSGPVHKLKNDSRITRVGRFLRQTSLDELPQLINVALGQMSLVGPRPELPEIVLEHYEPWQYRRLIVPQGITGWWQVTGRGKKLLRKHTNDDIYYVEHASFWFDIKLLLMTIRAVISRDGAF